MTNLYTCGEAYTNLHEEEKTELTAVDGDSRSGFWSGLSIYNRIFVIDASDSLMYVQGGNPHGAAGVGQGTGSSSTLYEWYVDPQGFDWEKFSAGDDFSIGLRTDGTIWSAGRHDGEAVGCLGLGSGQSEDVDTFTQIGTDSDWIDISAGWAHVLAIKSDGTLWCWGNDQEGELGLGDTGSVRYTPTQVGTATNWVKVVAGTYTSYALNDEGDLYACGQGNNGALGLGDWSDRDTFTHTAYGVDTLSAGTGHTIFVGIDGTLWGAGSNSDGELGLGDSTTSVNIWTQIGSSSNWEECACGGDHSLARKSDNSLYSCGDNYYGQLGNGISGYGEEVYYFTEIESDGDWEKIYAGVTISAAMVSAEPGISWGPPSTPSGIDTLSGGDIYITAKKVADGVPWAACMPSFWMSGVSIAYNWLIHTGVEGEYYPLNYDNLAVYLYGRYDSNKHLVRVTSGETWTAEELLTGDFGATEKFVSMREVAMADTDLYFHITKYGGTEGKIYEYDGVLTDRATIAFQPSVGYTMTDDNGILNDYVGCSGVQSGPIRKYNAVDGWAEQTGLPETAITDIEGSYY